MSEDLIGLIPAAGKGVRLSLPYPKELYPIIREKRYKPIAQYVLENLTASSVQDIVFVINETKHQLIGYFGSGARFNCHISYVVQENTGNVNASTSPGLAHALDSAHHLVKGKTVLFGMADTIMKPINVFEQILNGAEADDEVILGLFNVNRPEKFGMVEADERGRVQRIIDKPANTDLQYAWGCIVWRPRFTEYLHEAVSINGISDFARIMNSAIDEGFPFRAVVLEDGSYSDLGTYDEVVELERNRWS